MDMPPPQEIQSPPSQVRTLEGDVDDLYKFYVLDRIDGPDIPEHVKKFANDNNCFYIMKKYYWSSKLFKNNGGVYDCIQNNKVQYILDNNKKIRFAHWYTKHKIIHTRICEN